MLDRIMENEDKEVSRRDILKGAGIAAVGAGVLSIGGLGLPTVADAKKTKFNVKKAGDIAYKQYGKVFCAETVIQGLVEAGGIKGVDPSDYFWGHGGMVGWGTACGTLIGAGVVIGKVVDDKKVAQMVLNDVMAYYAYTTMPVYKPKKAIISDIKSATKAGTPLCHISVGKWMKAENVKFFSAERKERCGRISADIAIKTAELLNQYAAGKYKPSHPVNAATYQITTQENCTDCHGGNTPSLPGV